MTRRANRDRPVYAPRLTFPLWPRSTRSCVPPCVFTSTPVHVVRKPKDHCSPMDDCLLKAFFLPPLSLFWESVYVARPVRLNRFFFSNSSLGYEGKFGQDLIHVPLSDLPPLPEGTRSFFAPLIGEPSSLTGVEYPKEVFLNGGDPFKGGCPPASLFCARYDSSLFFLVKPSSVSAPPFFCLVHGGYDRPGFPNVNRSFSDLSPFFFGSRTAFGSSPSFLEAVGTFSLKSEWVD